MGRKQHGLEGLFSVIIRHCANAALRGDGAGRNRGASKPGDKQLGCEESEE